MLVLLLFLELFLRKFGFTDHRLLHQYLWLIQRIADEFLLLLSFKHVRRLFRKHLIAEIHGFLVPKLHNTGVLQLDCARQLLAGLVNLLRLEAIG